MRWIEFALKGTRYTLAADIQKEAEKHGYKVPCENDGTRHPGTDCNSKMRSIMKNAGLRAAFGIKADSVVDVFIREHSNKVFAEWCVECGLIGASFNRHGTIQLYTPEAANALLSVMTKSHVYYEIDSNDSIFRYRHPVVLCDHSLEMAKNKPKASLFRK